MEPRQRRPWGPGTLWAVAFWLILAGFGFQAAGVAVTAYGARKTWQEWATAPFPPKRWMVHTMLRFRYWLERVVLRRPPRTIVGSGVVVSVGGSVNARGRIGWGPLQGKTAKGQIAELDIRLRDLANSVFNRADALEDSVSEVRRDLAAIGWKLDETAADLKRQTRRVAVGGIVWESFGLLLVVVGLTLQALGFVVDVTT